MELISPSAHVRMWRWCAAGVRSVGTSSGLFNCHISEKCLTLKCWELGAAGGSWWHLAGEVLQCHVKCQHWHWHCISLPKTWHFCKPLQHGTIKPFLIISGCSMFIFWFNQNIVTSPVVYNNCQYVHVMTFDQSKTFMNSCWHSNSQRVSENLSFFLTDIVIQFPTKCPCTLFGS